MLGSQKQQIQARILGICRVASLVLQGAGNVSGTDQVSGTDHLTTGIPLYGVLVQLMYHAHMEYSCLPAGGSQEQSPTCSRLLDQPSLVL